LEYFANDRTGGGWVYNWRKINELRMNTGDFASDCLYVSYGSGSGYNLPAATTVDYLLNAQYKRLKGILFLDFDSRSIKNVSRLNVWGDGKQIYKSTDISSGFMPVEFDIDISGVNTLKIGAEFEEGIANTIGISNTVLIP